MPGRPIEPIRIPFYACYPDKWLDPKKAGQLSLEALGAWFKAVNLMWSDGTGVGAIEATIPRLVRVLGANSIEQMKSIIDELIDLEIGAVRMDGNKAILDSPTMRKEWEIAASKLKRKRTRDRESKREESSNTGQKGIIDNDNTPNSERVVADSSLSLSSSKSLSSSESDKEEKVSSSFGDAVRIFVKHTRWEPPNMYADQIQHRVKDLDVWESVVIAWVAEGYRKTSVIKMIEKYEQERIEVKKAKGGKAPMCPRCKKNRLHPAYGICVSCVEDAEKAEESKRREATVVRGDQFSPPTSAGAA